MSRRAGWWLVGVTMSFELAGGNVHADGPPPTPATCIAASLKGQQLRLAGRWGAATESLAVCADGGCPTPIRHDCMTWMEEIKAASPTIVLGAEDATGHDLTDVRVTVDGVDRTAQADGQAVALDPGRHVVRYTRPDGASVEQEFVMREGEKGRKLVLTFPAAQASAIPAPARAIATPPPQPPRPPPSAPPSPHGHMDGAVAITAGVAAAAFVGIGVYAEVHQSSLTSSLTTQCLDHACASPPASAQVGPDVQTINLYRGLGGASFGLAAAALGVAGVFLFARPIDGSHPSTTGTLGVAPLPGGAALGYRVAF